MPAFLLTLWVQITHPGTWPTFVWPLVVWPALTAAVSFFHAKIEPAFPKLTAFLKATGVDLPKLWSLFQKAAPPGQIPPLPPSLGGTPPAPPTPPSTLARRMTLGLATAGLGLFLAACNGVWGTLAVINGTIALAISTLSNVRRWIDSYFATHPNASLQAKVDAGFQKASDALTILEQAYTAAKDITDANLQGAIAAFQAAYQALLDLIAPIGIHPPGTMSLATEGVVEHVVPPASEFAASRFVK